MPIVAVKIEIPDGWELVEDFPRMPREGEYYLNLRGDAKLASFDYEATLYYIVKKKAPVYKTMTSLSIHKAECGVKWVEIKALKDALTLFEMSVGKLDPERPVYAALKQLVEE